MPSQLDERRAPARTSGRLDALTGMRFAAALGVCICHIFEFDRTPGALGYLLDFGRFGVDFFFILSGFVLTWSWAGNRSVRRFYWSRLSRIWPIHLVVLAILLPLRIGGPPIDPLMEALEVFFLVQWFPLTGHHTMSLNPVTWTLSVEVVFYLALPLVLPWLRRQSTRRMLTVVGAAWLGGACWSVGAEHVLHIRSPWWLALNPVLWMPEFFLGVASAIVLKRFGAFSAAVASRMVALGCAFIPLEMLLYAAVGSGWVDGRYVPPWAFFVDVPCALIISGTASLELRSLIRSPRWLVILGEWSFALYLIHRQGVIFALGPHVRRLPDWGSGVIMLAVMIAASGVLYVYVERPLERWFRARGPKS